MTYILLSVRDCICCNLETFRMKKKIKADYSFHRTQLLTFFYFSKRRKNKLEYLAV